VVSDGHPFKSTDGITWTEITNGLPADNPATFPPGPAQTLAVHLASGTLFAGTYGNGVFKSVDGGASWFSSSAGLSSTAIRPLAVDQPSTPSFITLFAGTAGNGISMSVDGGATWSGGNTGNPLVEIDAIAVNPVTDSIVYAVGRSPNGAGGVVRSIDGGFTWTLLSPGVGLYWQPGAALALVVAPAPLYVPNGPTLQKFAPGIPAGTTASVGNTQITGAVRSAETGALFAATNGLGVFRSLDDGATWTPVNSGLRGVQSPFGGA